MDKEIQIKSYLSYVFNHIVDGLDGELKELVKSEGVIAGGAIRSLYTGAPINDIDIYMQNPESAERVRSIVNDHINSGTGYFSKMKVMKLLWPKSRDEEFLSENAWTFVNSKVGLKVQLIYKYSGKPEQLIKKFDFTNSQAVYIPQSDVLILPGQFKSALLEKRLEFNEDCFSPVYSLDRMFKFVRGGYIIDRRNLMKIVKAAAKDEKNHKHFEAGGDLY